MLNKDLFGFNKLIFMVLTIYIATIYVWGDSPQMVFYSNLCFFVFAAFEVSNILKSDSIYIHEYLLFYNILLFYSLISIIWANDTNAVISDVRKLTLLTLAMFLIYNYISKTGNLELFIKSLLIAGIFMCIYTIFYYGPVDYFLAILSGERIGGEVAQLNSLGMYSTNTAILTLYYAVFQKKVHYYIILILPILVTIGSGSRKALIILLISSSMIFLLKPQKINNILKKVVTLFMIICALLLIINVASEVQFLNGISNRMHELLEFVQSKNTDYSRYKMLKYGWNYFLEHPILGAGSGNSHIVTLEAIGKKTYLHNNYIEMLVNGGVIGFFIYYMMYVYIIKSLIPFCKKGNHLTIVVMILICTQLIADMGVTSYTNKMTFIYITLGFLAVRMNKVRMLHQGLIRYEKRENHAV